MFTVFLSPDCNIRSLSECGLLRRTDELGSSVSRSHWCRSRFLGFCSGWEKKGLQLVHGSAW